MKNLFKYIDHTNLSRSAKFDDIKMLCDEAVDYGVASVMIPPCYVSQVHKEYFEKLKIGTVIGFPNGYNTTETKCFESQQAIENGADEIDVVINNNFVKDKRFDLIKSEIIQIRNVCKSPIILKVIVETCLLTRDELIELTKIVSESGADYIKTSTGFSTGGANLDDISIIMQSKSSFLKVKASGGIKTYDQIVEFIDAGCNRIGASNAIKAISEMGE